MKVTLVITKHKLRAKETVYWPGLNDNSGEIGTKLPIMLEVFEV